MKWRPLIVYPDVMLTGEEIRIINEWITVTKPDRDGWYEIPGAVDHVSYTVIRRGPDDTEDTAADAP